MICLSKLLKSIAEHFCLFCCWSWRGSTHCHHLISTMIWLRENDNKMVQSWELHLSWLQSISWTKWCWQPGQEVSKVTGGWRRDAELFNILVHTVLVTGGGPALSMLCGSLRVDESFTVELLSTSSCSNHGYNRYMQVQYGEWYVGRFSQKVVLSHSAEFRIPGTDILLCRNYLPCDDQMVSENFCIFVIVW